MQLMKACRNKMAGWKGTKAKTLRTAMLLTETATQIETVAEGKAPNLLPDALRINWCVSSSTTS
jgi:hypothetical protein